MKIVSLFKRLFRRLVKPASDSPEYLQPKRFLLYYRAKQKLYKKESAAAKTGQIVFLGDSITDGCDLHKFYPGLIAFNRGIGGDTAKGVYDRMEVSVFALRPALVVLLIGINDINNHKKDNAVILGYYEKILSAIKERLPETRVIAQSVYPVYSKGASDIGKNNAQIVSLNEGIRALTKKYGYIYAPTWERLTDKEGKLAAAYADDGLHPNEEGYKVISSYLTSIIKEAVLKTPG